MSKKSTQNLINIIVFIICIVIITFGNYTIQKINSLKMEINSNIENEWRQQAKRTLSNLENQFMYDVRNNLVDPYNEISLQTWAKRNISGVFNGGDTSDAFMINLVDEKFIWDGSPDCARPEFIIDGRFMKDEPLLHVDKDQAQYIINKMKQGKSTLNSYDKNWWNFDGSPEYLEWVVIPPGYLGFNDESITIGGVKNANYTKLLIALGTQEDEVRSTFSKTYKDLNNISFIIEVFVICSIIIFMFNMIIYLYMAKRLRKK